MARTDKKNRKLGWKRDLPDPRDYFYAEHRFALERIPVLPPKVDLRHSGFMPPIRDQGETSACTAHAVSSAVEFLHKKQGEGDITLSRLFIYWNERAIEGETNADNGATLRDGMLATAKQGACLETTWPFDVKLLLEKPSPAAFTEGLKTKNIQYTRLNNKNIKELKTCLAAGYPFVFGITVFDSFEVGDDNGGYVPMPSKNDQVEGGHALLCVGYDDSNKHWIIKNSWGVQPGDAGYYYLPYAYLTDVNLAGDFWTVRKVT